jgi:hypothetical protein
MLGGFLLVVLFVTYIVLSVMKDYREYEQEQHDRWGDNT